MKAIKIVQKTFGKFEIKFLNYVFLNKELVCLY